MTTPYQQYPQGVSDKSKVVAGILQILLGGFGAGRFYIGDTKTAVIQLVVTHRDLRLRRGLGPRRRHPDPGQRRRRRPGAPAARLSGGHGKGAARHTPRGPFRRAVPISGAAAPPGGAAR